MTTVRLIVDGMPRELTVTPSTSLLRALRDAGVTGPKGACEQGECGSCAVVIDGAMENACLVPAAVCEGSVVQTVAGLLTDDLADALARYGAVQCGFCTPGFVVAAQVLLATATGPLDATSVREGLEGNLCRCTGYQQIVDAVVAVDRERRR